jgi:hypothetical protein
MKVFLIMQTTQSDHGYEDASQTRQQVLRLPNKLAIRPARVIAQAVLT